MRAMARVFERVRHCRDDFAHQTAHDLTTTHGVACGFECHADVNAARVILALGLRASGRGGLAIGPPMKRQPSEEEVAYAAA